MVKGRTLRAVCDTVRRERRCPCRGRHRCRRRSIGGTAGVGLALSVIVGNTDWEQPELPTLSRRYPADGVRGSRNAAGRNRAVVPAAPRRAPAAGYTIPRHQEVGTPRDTTDAERALT